MSKKTVALIASQRQHYLIKVKGNQRKLLTAMQQAAAEGAAAGHWQESEHNRGREVQRVLDFFPASAQARAEWPGLVWFVRLVRQGRRQGKAYERSSYYICSCEKADAAMLAEAIRGHWGIENRVHWEKDVTLKEDSNGISKGQAPENLSLLKSMALNIARRSGFLSMKDATMAFANKITLMTKYIRT
nr:ISAs1 family transposase [Pontibacter diazotrophicus]